jgi:hypothetical protein
MVYIVVTDLTRVKWLVSQVEQELLFPGFQWNSCSLIFSFLCNVLSTIVCLSVLIHFAIVLSVLELTAAEYNEKLSATCKHFWL